MKCSKAAKPHNIVLNLAKSFIFDRPTFAGLKIEQHQELFVPLPCIFYYPDQLRAS
jgi:hypothetical protein